MAAGWSALAESSSSSAWNLALAFAITFIFTTGAYLFLEHGFKRPLPKFVHPSRATKPRKLAKYLTVRVRGISLAVTKEELQVQLDSLKYDIKEIETSGNNIVQLSLVREDGQGSCATVTFQHRPILLKDLEEVSQVILRPEPGYTFDMKFLNLTPLHNGDGRGEPIVDLIAVPGLGSHPLGTWKSRDTSEVWLRDFLPEDVPNIRVLIYGYDTNLVKSDSKQSINDLAKTLLESIKAYRATTSTRRRPMILIGHSLGGLLVKEALYLASRFLKDKKNLEIYESCYALLFFGVPNLGLRNHQLFAMVKGQPNKKLIDELMVDNDSEPSSFLVALSQHFSDCCKNQSIKCIAFFERKESPTVMQNPDQTWVRKGPKRLMVSRDSATRIGLSETPNEFIPLDADHSDIVKFENSNDQAYSIVKDKIAEFVNEAPSFSMDDANILPVFSEDEKELLRSLAFHELGKRELNIKPALPGTCNWLYDRPEYCMWRKREKLEEHRGLLWIKGIPGAGKSTLMKNVLRKSRTENPASTIISFFFNARGAPLEKEPLGMFRSLIYQLCQIVRPFPADLLSKFIRKQTMPNGWEWDLEELRELFSNFVASSQIASLTIFVDALDECDNSEVPDIVSYFEDLTVDAISCTRALNICLSSRHYPHVSVSKYVEIIVENCNSHDISLYVDSKLRLKSAAELELKKKLIDKASGIFMWVFLVVKTLSKIRDDGGTLISMQAALDSSPSQLKELFTGYFDEIRAEDRQESLRLMQWVLFAKRPLTPREMNYALFCTFGSSYADLEDFEGSKDDRQDDQRIEKYIRALSKGLVEVKHVEEWKQEDEYFVPKNAFSGTKEGNDGEEAANEEHTIQDRSISQMRTSEIGRYEGIKRRRDIMAKTKYGQEPIEAISQSNLTADFDSNATIIGTEDKTFVQFIHESVRDFLLTHGGLRILDSSFTGSAIARSQDQITRGLINHLSMVQINGVSVGESCLSSLESRGQELAELTVKYPFLDYAVRSLFHHMAVASAERVERGRIIKQDSLYLDAAFLEWTAASDLMDALRGTVGESNSRDTAVVDVNVAKNLVQYMANLLDEEDNPNFRGAHSNNPLLSAIATGHEEVVRQMLRCGVDVGLKDDYGRTALHYAVRKGSTAVVELLLKQGADVHVVDNDGLTALLHLQFCNQFLDGEIAKLLLDREAQIDASDDEGQSAIFRAVDGSIHWCLRVLLDHGANIQKRNKKGETALHYAAASNNLSAVELLIDRNADIGAVDSRGHTALHHAIFGYRWPDVELVQLLLERGADIQTKNENEETLLHHAAIRRDIRMINLLLVRGADVNAVDRNRQNALHGVIGHFPHPIDVISLLLNRGADICATDNDGSTYLHLAVKPFKHSVELGELLIRRGVEVEKVDNLGRTSLHWAAAEGHNLMVILLLENGAKLEAADKEGDTPLRLALREGRKKTAQLLRKYYQDQQL